MAESPATRYIRELTPGRIIWATVAIWLLLDVLGMLLVIDGKEMTRAIRTVFFACGIHSSFAIVTAFKSGKPIL